MENKNTKLVENQIWCQNVDFCEAIYQKWHMEILALEIFELP